MCYDMDDDDMYFEFEGEKLEDDEDDEEENYPWIYDIQEVDIHDELVNSAYDESGNAVPCRMCTGEMKWSPSKRVWYCPECDYEFDREDFFCYIGANPPGPKCITCLENYPYCKKYCAFYDIDPDDPIL